MPAGARAESDGLKGYRIKHNVPVDLEEIKVQEVWTDLAAGKAPASLAKSGGLAAADSSMLSEQQLADCSKKHSGCSRRWACGLRFRLPQEPWRGW